MKGFIKATVAGLCLGTGFTTLVGCHSYRQMVDPCWPERYNAEARLSVRDTFAAQQHNGHVLDQTVWNYHFEPATDRLNASGMEHLRYLARRQPVPDTNLFLQTAQDVPGAAGLAPDKSAEARSDLDNRRIASIQKFLAGATSGRAQFEVAIHDPGEVGIAAIPIGGSGSAKPAVIKGSLQQLYENSKGKMPGVEGVTLTTTGGSN